MICFLLLFQQMNLLLFAISLRMENQQKEPRHKLNAFKTEEAL